MPGPRLFLTTTMMSPDDLFKQPIRHPQLSFDDGNIAILTGDYYFLVHKGLLCHHSKPFMDFAQALEQKNAVILDGRPVIELDDSPNDMAHFLRSLYDGMYNANDFAVVSSILLLATKYQALMLRSAILEQLAIGWPNSLKAWEERERLATDNHGVYSPRPAFPHPILIINLAKAIDAPELLPSAFYDLSRYQPSELVAGYTCPSSIHHTLQHPEIFATLRGRECAARFFSTFIVTHLEGREPSPQCTYAGQPAHEAARKGCKTVFESITFEILRDVNGMVCNRNSDPLYAMAAAPDVFVHLGTTKRTIPRTCEECRQEFMRVVNASRHEFWRNLPEWFDVEVENWG
ncbi:hypothetical protein BD410DRAFT_722773 [Rickenella mellea]|uniref:BTB domain-containing protein n=1 Tax=Rickenella mellea TaxID=50990 RepID=A0A4Y7Q514_9AGAM|nr:hypothetical protein BD410DRAFT_722773 [Rickenella mellea]